MNRPTHEGDTSSKIKRAEDAVTQSIEKFESAMEHLAEKVEDTGQRVQHTVELATKSKDQIMAIKENTIDPLRPYVQQAIDTSRDLSTRVQSNPRPYVIGGLAFVAGLLAWAFYQTRPRSTSSEFISDFDRRDLGGSTFRNEAGATPY